MALLETARSRVRPETFARAKVTNKTEPCQGRYARPCAKTHLWGPGFGPLIWGRLLRNTLAPL
jgi:hypothetical protein